MPRYKWNIEEVLFEEDVRVMLDKAKNKHEAILVCLLWETGARPAELLKLKPEDFTIETNKAKVQIETLKLGDGGQFKIRKRILEFTRSYGLETNVYIEMIINHLKSSAPGQPILPYGKRWAEKVINRLGQETIGKEISPYHFRHSVMTWLAENGWDIHQIKYFKGAATLASVEAYIHAKPKLVEWMNLNRSKHKHPFIKDIRLSEPEPSQDNPPAIPGPSTN